jgi:hypothetical protein
MARVDALMANSLFTDEVAGVMPKQADLCSAGLIGLGTRPGSGSPRSAQQEAVRPRVQQRRTTPISDVN